MLVGGIAIAMGVRSLVMQHHWTHWWSLETFRLAHALEYAMMPILGVLGAAFYRWVAGLDPNERRIVWHRRVGGALLPLCAVVPASNGLTGPVLNAIQLFAVWSMAETVVAVRVALRAVPSQERRIIVVGVGALIVGVSVDLVVTRISRATYFLGIGALAPGVLIEMVCQTLIVAKRNSRAHDRVDELAGELEDKNVALTATNALLEVSNTKLEDTNGILASELDERRRLQGELDTAAQQLTQAENMATLGMLMAGIAHDLRNPLNYVQGAAEQLREAIPSLRSADEGVREKSLIRVEKVVGWVEQGTASMDAISLAMRNQARGGGAALETMNLRDVVNEALLLCKSRLAGCDVNVAVQNTTIVADPTGVGQLVMNLVSNAADALKEAHEKAPRDSHEIRVVGAVADGQVILEVHDSGPGIPEQLRAKILEPFFTTKPRGQGTGLGLAIVQRVVKQHGGSLQIARSDALGGARFECSWRCGS